MIKLTADQLRELADRIDNESKYHNMCGYVIATIERHPNGREYLQFEQPCGYAECFSTYYTYDSK